MPEQAVPVTGTSAENAFRSPETPASAGRRAAQSDEGQQGGKSPAHEAHGQQGRNSGGDVRGQMVDELAMEPGVGRAMQGEENRARGGEQEPGTSHPPPRAAQEVLGHGVDQPGYSPPPPMVTLVHPAAAHAFMTSMMR